MTNKKTPATAFKPGQSGNPAGKPKGTRNHATRSILKLMEGGAEEITIAVLDAAKGGDMGAARFILERIAPPLRERPISIDLPAIDTADGIAAAQEAILQAVAAGDLMPGEANTLSNIVESRRKAIETQELAARLDELERKMEK